MKRPTGSNADEWVLFLQYWLNDMPRRVHDNIPFLAVQIAEAIDAPEWQPIETAPKDGKEILTFSPPGPYAGCIVNTWSTKHRTDGEWWRSSTANPPTHWQPLPAPPRQA